MQFNLRNAEKFDLELTFRIKINSLKPYIEKIWAWNDVHQHEMHEVNFIPSNTKIIEYDKQEIGYLVLKETKCVIHIENLLIITEFQNLKIGQKIMERIIEKANLEDKSIQLQVFKINYKAQRFYKNLGFEKTFENENHIGMKKNWFQ